MNLQEKTEIEKIDTCRYMEKIIRKDMWTWTWTCGGNNKKRRKMRYVK